MPLEYLTVNHLSTKDLIRIFSKITINPNVQWNGTPCWTWTAKLDIGGYGCTKIRSVSHKVHRLMYAWLVEPIPLDFRYLQLDHLCRHRDCGNPVHLELVTPRVNVLRGNTIVANNLTKTHCPQGHPYSGKNLKTGKDRRRLCWTCQRKARKEWAQTQSGKAANCRYQQLHRQKQRLLKLSSAEQTAT